MSTITLHISYQSPNQSKKVSIPTSTTVSQLILKSLQLYKIDSNSYAGTLSHNNKQLEGSLSIRLTNLINNSKLILKTKKIDMNKEINIKFILESNLPVIKKVNANTNLLDLIKMFDSVDVEKHSQLRIFNLSIDSSKYKETKLNSLIGDASNVVIRLDYLKSGSEIEKLKQEQVKINQLQVEQNKIRMEKEEERRRQREKKRVEEKLEEELRIEKQEEFENISKESVKLEDVEMKDGPEQIQQHLNQDSSNYTFQEETSKDPQLFIPSKEPQQLYQNPDEDYQMTLNQAKAYQNSIRNSGKRVKKSQQEKIPSKYHIRIKFPDGSILQINFTEETQNVKFGQLVKKIEELLKPQFVNQYSLKYGHPPFKKIDLTFDNNNQFLYKLPDFQSERILLIWELNKQDLNLAKGPYLKNDELVVRQTNELPERVLESHRGELPNEEQHNVTPIADKKDEKSKLKSKVPKWFKTK